MTMTHNVRFLDPVDPRTVWERGMLLINAPEGYRWERRAAGEPSWPGDTHPYLFASWRAEPGQGADALMWMDYGPEGSLINEHIWDEEDEQYRPPPAYVELSFDVPYSQCDTRVMDGYSKSLLIWHGYNGRLMQYRGEDHTEWREVTL